MQKRTLTAFLSLSTYFNEEELISIFSDALELVQFTPGKDLFELEKYYVPLVATWSADFNNNTIYNSTHLNTFLNIAQNILQNKNAPITSKIKIINELNIFLSNESIEFEIDKDIYVKLIDKWWALMSTLSEISLLASDFAFNLHPYTLIYLSIPGSKIFDVDISEHLPQDPLKLYLYYFAKTELTRRKLQAKNGRTNKDFGKLYKEMQLSQIAALNIRYNTDLTYDELEQGKTISPLAKINGEIVHTEYGKLLKLPSETTIPAGIYLLENNFRITGNIIRFHPLAMILAPEKNIEISANRVENAWIDVSAKKARTPEKSAFYTYFQSELPVQMNSQNQGWIDWRGRDQAFWAQSRRQSSGVDGPVAGNISIEVDSLKSDGTILVARGGDGSDGIDGEESLTPDKTSLQFHVWKQNCVEKTITTNNCKTYEVGCP